MEQEEINEYCFKKLNHYGIKKFQYHISKEERHELHILNDALKLCKTCFNHILHLTVYIDNKKGTYLLNNLYHEDLDKAIRMAIENAESSVPDVFNDVSEYQPHESFSKGSKEFQIDIMQKKMMEFLGNKSLKYPQIIVHEAVYSFNKNNTLFVNSNNVKFDSFVGHYEFFLTFISDNQKIGSSLNYTYVHSGDCNKPLIEYPNIESALKLAAEEKYCRELKGKFIGTVILSPDCFLYFINQIVKNLHDIAYIGHSSLFMDKMNENIASPILTLKSQPTSAEMASGYFVTNDGYKAKDITLIENGILMNFLLGLYASKKTGQKAAHNNGGFYVVEPGKKSYADMVKETKKGILLSRYSGAEGDMNGNFSGIAKNSYLIEDGEITCPLTDVMIAGNLNYLLMNITDISNERIHFGDNIIPWIKANNLLISGK